MTAREAGNVMILIAVIAAVVVILSLTLQGAAPPGNGY